MRRDLPRIPLFFTIVTMEAYRVGSKRFVYESGTHIPFVIRIPEKYKHLFPSETTGSRIDRLISFVDLAPTLLSIAEIPVPDWLQGNAFLGDQKTEDPEYAFMFRGRMDERYDMSRAVRDQKFRYIRNYIPYRIYLQHINYLWKAPSMRSWEEACLSGNCDSIQMRFWKTKPAEELYDTENDPWEIRNLAADPGYNDVLSRMRKAEDSWVRKIYDTGFMPEAMLLERAGNDISFYALMRSDSIPFNKIVDAANLFTLGRVADRDSMVASSWEFRSCHPILGRYRPSLLLARRRQPEMFYVKP